MTDRNSTLTAARLRELLTYDPATGVFTWRVKRRGAPGIGAIAGASEGRPNPSGFCYWNIGVDYGHYKRSRLAWLYVYGQWPAGEVDHKDGNESNDSIANLREATRRQNSQNTGLRKHNAARLKGVRYYKRDVLRKHWNARINVNGIEKCLGYFLTDVEAAAAYDEAAIRLHGEFAKTNKMLGLLP